MRKRYYCDYCDKTFIDDLDARKKHLQSSYHTKLRSIHYERHRDPRTLLKEECEKTPCRRFFNNGTCQFDGICKYTHYTPEQLWEIKLQVDYQEHTKQVRVPTIEPWLQKYHEKHNKENVDVVTFPWSYPQQLEHRTDLPPSIKRFHIEQFTHDNFEEWG